MEKCEGIMLPHELLGSSGNKLTACGIETNKISSEINFLARCETKTCVNKHENRNKATSESWNKFMQ